MLFYSPSAQKDGGKILVILKELAKPFTPRNQEEVIRIIRRKNTRGLEQYRNVFHIAKEAEIHYCKRK